MNGDTIINNSIDNIDDDNDGTSGSLVKSNISFEMFEFCYYMNSNTP